MKPLMPYTGPSPGTGAPPNSPPPVHPGGGVQNNYGQTWGTQAVLTWAPGEADRRPVLDMVRAASLWRVSAIGDVRVFARWGTSGTHELELHTPIDCTFPGFCSLEAGPRVEQHEDIVQAIISATPVWGAGREEMRALVDATAGAIALAPEACRLRAISAGGCAVTIRTIAVAVPLLGEVELLAPSVLTSGVAIVEYMA